MTHPPREAHETRGLAPPANTATATASTAAAPVATPAVLVPARAPIAAPPRVIAHLAATTPAAAPTAEIRKLPDTAALGEKWGALMEAARDNRRLRVLLIDVVPVAWSSGTLTLRPATPVMALPIDAARVEIGSLANLVVPGTTSVVLERDDAPQQAAAPVSNLPTAQEMSEHPLIKHAIALFGGKVTFVQARKPAEK